MADSRGGSLGRGRASGGRAFPGALELDEAVLFENRQQGARRYATGYDLYDLPFGVVDHVQRTASGAERPGGEVRTVAVADVACQRPFAGDAPFAGVAQTVAIVHHVDANEMHLITDLLRQGKQLWDLSLADRAPVREKRGDGRFAAEVR